MRTTLLQMSSSAQSSAATLIALLAVFTSSAAFATIPYGSLANGTPGGLGPDLAPPSIVPGKEYSHDQDHQITAAGTSLSPEQIVAWDGQGGVQNGQNFVGTRQNFTVLSQHDALANAHDFLFNPLRNDSAHLIFSIDDRATAQNPGAAPLAVTVPSAGPILLSNGNSIGGAGEISYEKAGAFAPPSTQGIWATQGQINGMPFPDDIDGIEVWGPEPADKADTNKYSLDTDIAVLGLGNGVSVWNLSGGAYITHSFLANAVMSLLGAPAGTAISAANVNLDALMVLDIVDNPDVFQRDQTGGDDHDRIIFSIRQIPDPQDPTGYYATGSELFVLDPAGANTISYLFHGQHAWDKQYALNNLKTTVLIQDTFVDAQLDINAIEAISSTVVPEPVSLLMLLIGLVGAGSLRVRRN